jgi:hypothetical protein
MLLLLLHTIWEGEKERWGVTWVAWKVKQFCKEKTEVEHRYYKNFEVKEKRTEKLVVS